MPNKLFYSGPKPKKSAISIYIGHESVEIIQIKRGLRGPSVVKSICKDIPKEEISGEKIKDIFQSEGIKETSVTSTIAEEAVMLRRFTMPIIPNEERATAVKFEAKRHIPFNIDEVISSFHIIKENRIKNQMEVLFAAVKKDEINSLIEILDQAELKIEKIEPISLALIKSLTLSGNLKIISPPTAILHFVTKNRAHIIIVENGIPYIKREVSLVGKETNVVDHVLTEIRLSSSYYKREFPDKNITKLIVCGLKEHAPWLAAIKSTLNIPVEQAAPLKSLTGKDFPAPQLEIAIGLASRRLQRPLVELDLLPKELVPVKYNIQKIAAIEICIGIAILGLVYITGIPALFKLNKQIASTQKIRTESPGLSLADKSNAELKKIQETWQQRRNILATFTKQRISWHQKLTKLAQIIPKETWITQLTLGDSIGIIGSRVLILKCTTYTKDPAKEIELSNSFFQKLKENPVFMDGLKGINLGTITKVKIDGYEVVNFDISATGD